jgi:hypothetical protein
MENQARETRPLIGELRAELAEFRAEMKAELKQINRKFDTVGGELLDLRATTKDHDERLSEIERPKQ